MRFPTAVAAIAALLSTPFATAAPINGNDGLVTRAAIRFTGYLVSTFTDANPAVQLYLSKGNDPSSFSFLNKAKAVLTSTVGTKAVRDIFLAHDSARAHWYMLGTGGLRDVGKTYFGVVLMSNRSRYQRRWLQLGCSYTYRQPGDCGLEVEEFGRLVCFDPRHVSAFTLRILPSTPSGYLHSSLQRGLSHCRHGMGPIRSVGRRHLPVLRLLVRPPLPRQRHRAYRHSNPRSHPIRDDKELYKLQRSTRLPQD